MTNTLAYLAAPSTTEKDSFIAFIALTVMNTQAYNIAELVTVAYLWGEILQDVSLSVVCNSCSQT